MGIIGTHISPRAQRQGVGTGLFLVSQQAALEAGLRKTDAYIGADNAVALRYYDSLGFGLTGRGRGDSEGL
jgi:RimJ/RimL family protein N-acetyltransferase